MLLGDLELKICLHFFKDNKLVYLSIRNFKVENLYCMYSSLNILYVHRSKQSTEIISPESYVNVDVLKTDLMVYREILSNNLSSEDSGFSLQLSYTPR